jgi:hypothetical protein
MPQLRLVSVLATPVLYGRTYANSPDAGVPESARHISYARLSADLITLASISNAN